MKYFVEYDIGGEQYTTDLVAPLLEEAEQQARSEIIGTILNVRPYDAPLRQARVLRSVAYTVRYHGSIAAVFLFAILMLASRANFASFVLLASLFLVAWLIVILLTFVLTGIAGLLERG